MKRDAICIATIGTMRIGVNKFSNREAFRSFSWGERDAFAQESVSLLAAIALALSPARCWPRPGIDVPRNIFSCACQLSLDRSAWHSQDFGCLINRKTVHYPQLKCPSQRGG